jgi:type II secretory pathway component PulF
VSVHYQVLATFDGKTTEKAYFVVDVPMARRAALRDGAQAIYRVKKVSRSWLTQQVIGQEYAMLLLRAINFQTEAGVPPVKAVQIAIESETDPEKRSRMQGALDSLSRGAPISDALYETGLYDLSVKSILKAGERTGASTAIGSAMQFIEDRKEVWKGYGVFLSALFMELSTALTVPPAIDKSVIPYLRENPPKITQEALATYMSQLDTMAFNNLLWMWFSFFACFCIVFLVLLWYSNAEAKDWIAKRILIRLPMLGEWYANDALYRSFKIFASMLTAGLRINDAIDTILASTGNPVATRFWRMTREALNTGASPGSAFAASGLLRKDEATVLKAVRGNSQVARVFISMSNDRAWRQKMLTAKIFRYSIFATIGYIGITIAICFRLFSLFNSGLDMSMDSMIKGM